MTWSAVLEAHRLQLDRDAPLALEVHRVEVLGAHRAGVDGAADLEHPVGEGRLAVVDVGDDRDVAEAVQRSGGSGGHGPISLPEPDVATGIGPGPDAPLPGPLSSPGPPTAPTPGRGTGEYFDMANIKSQIKRNRTNEAARERNKAVRSEVRTRIKHAEQATAAGADDAAELTRLAIASLDKAATKGVIHRNAAARRKSRLMRQLNAVDA